MEEVPAQVLRETTSEYAQTLLPDLYSWATFDVAWVQRYGVSTLCRVLPTLDCGRITPKQAALEWGRDNLDPVWSPLLQQMIDDRVLGFDANAAGGSMKDRPAALTSPPIQRLEPTFRLEPAALSAASLSSALSSVSLSSALSSVSLSSALSSVSLSSAWSAVIWSVPSSSSV